MVMKLLKAYIVDIGEFLRQAGYFLPNVEHVGESKHIPITIIRDNYQSVYN